MRIKLFALSKDSESSESSDISLVEVTIFYTKGISFRGWIWFGWLNVLHILYWV